MDSGVALQIAEHVLQLRNDGEVEYLSQPGSPPDGGSCHTYLCTEKFNNLRCLSNLTNGYHLTS